jgi:hypothetical protein
LEVFDSLGIDPNKLENLKLFLKFQGIKTLHYNETPFQNQNTDSCGLFVIYYVWQRMYNLDLTLDDILELSFEKDNNLNEVKVNNFCKSLEDQLL